MAERKPSVRNPKSMDPHPVSYAPIKQRFDLCQEITAFVTG
jgi:hypothetical protein